MECYNYKEGELTFKPYENYLFIPSLFNNLLCEIFDLRIRIVDNILNYLRGTYMKMEYTK